MMTISKAVSLIQEYYDEAIRNPYIRNPIAWALYKAWKDADKEQKK